MKYKIKSSSNGLGNYLPEVKYYHPKGKWPPEGEIIFHILFIQTFQRDPSILAQRQTGLNLQQTMLNMVNYSSLGGRVNSHLHSWPTCG